MKIQEDILSQARLDGGYPKAKLVGFGCVTLVRNEAEEKQIDRQNLISMLVGVVCGATGLVFGICWGLAIWMR